MERPALDGDDPGRVVRQQGIRPQQLLRVETSKRQRAPSQLEEPQRLVARDRDLADEQIFHYDLS